MNLREIILKSCLQDSDAVDFFIQVSELYSEQGNLDKALNIKEILLTLPLEKSKKEEILLKLSSDYHRSGMYDNALSVLDELFLITERKDEIVDLQSHLYIELKEWDKVMEVQKKKKNKNPEFLLYALCNLSKDLLAEGNKKRAVLLLKEAELISKDHPHILLHWLDIFIDDQNVSEIRALGEKIALSFPDYFGVYLEKLIDRKAINRDILELTMSQLRENRHNLYLIYQLARFLFSAERYEDLIKLLESRLEHLNQPALLRLYMLSLKKLDRQMDKRFYQSVINCIPEETRWFRCRECGYETEKCSFSCIRCNSINSFVLIRGNE